MFDELVVVDLIVDHEDTHARFEAPFVAELTGGQAR
jgi:hypothetical protein